MASAVPIAASARVVRRFSAAFPLTKFERGFSPCHIVGLMRRTSPRRRSAPRKLFRMFIGFALNRKALPRERRLLLEVLSRCSMARPVFEGARLQARHEGLSADIVILRRLQPPKDLLFTSLSNWLPVTTSLPFLPGPQPPVKPRTLQPGKEHHRPCASSQRRSDIHRSHLAATEYCWQECHHTGPKDNRRPMMRIGKLGAHWRISRSHSDERHIHSEYQRAVNHSCFAQRSSPAR